MKKKKKKKKKKKTQSRIIRFMQKYTQQGESMKTRKLALSIVLAMLFGSSAIYAENIDQEIAKLKKENELLELQQKNANLKNNKGKNESAQSSN